MGILERRYAEALLSLADSATHADRVGAKLSALGRLFVQNEELRGFILNPAISGKIRGETLFEIMGILGEDVGGDSGAALSGFLRLLLDKGRLAFLPHIADEYNLIKAKHRNSLRVTVRSTAPLDGATLERLCEKYRVQYGATMAEAENIIDGSIIGGVCVQIGDIRIDDTVYGRLAALARTIAAGAPFKNAEAG